MVREAVGMIQQLPGWAIGVLAAAFIVTILSAFLWGWARTKIFERANFKPKRFTRTAKWLDDNWGKVFVLSLIWLFAFMVAVITVFFGTEHLPAALAFAAIVGIFASLQMPRLLRPHVHVTFLRCDENGTYEDIKELASTLTRVEVHAGRRSFIFFRITNLGVNTYETCGCWILFHRGIKPVFGDELQRAYEEHKMDFARLPSYHRAENCLWFPGAPEVCLPPGGYLGRRAYIEAPHEQGEYWVKVRTYSTTRWGWTDKLLHLNVTQHAEKSSMGVKIVQFVREFLSKI